MKLKVFILLIISIKPNEVMWCEQDVFRAGLDDGTNLESYLSIYEDKAGQLRDASFQEIRSIPSFISWKDRNSENKALTDYWGRLKIENASHDLDTDWVIKFDLGLSFIKVFVIRSDGRVEEHLTGFFLPNASKTFCPTVKANLIKVDIQKNELVELLILFQSSRPSVPPVFDMKITEYQQYNKSLIFNKQNGMLYLGFVLMMLIYNVFMFIFSGDKANIHYSLYLLFIALFISYNSGALSDWVQDILTPDHPQYMYYAKFVSYFALISYLKFIRHFLNLKAFDPKWDRILNILSWMAVPFLIADYILMQVSNFSPNVSDIASTSYILIFIVVTLILIIPLFKIKAYNKQYILWGIVSMNTAIFITVMLRFQSIDFSTLPFKIGSIIEIILFSIGLVFRQQEMEIEKRQVQFELERSRLLQQREHEEAKRLQELNEFKSNVYANITHEFRTPLTVILGMADRIKGFDKEKEVIQRNSEDLLQLINQLLDLSKAESDQLSFNFINGDIVAYIQYLIDSLMPGAHAKNISITTTSDEDEYLMDYDELVIWHIINNVVSNAIKFTPEGGQVKIDLRIEDDRSDPQFFIIISDNGKGIPKEDLDRIFDRFYQSSPKGSHGTGLGLSLVKELLGRIEGHISVRSEEGVGSRFEISIPIKGSSRSYYDGRDISNGTEDDSLIAHDAIRDERPVVLLAEDHPDVLDYIASCLYEDYHVVMVDDGLAAWEKALEIIPDIVVTDLMMPELDGIELCQKLKTDKRTNHIPVILLTAKTGRRDKLEALKNRADAYINKPFDREELLLRIKSLLEMRIELSQRIATSESTKSTDITTIEIDPFITELRGYILAHLIDSDLTMEELQSWAGMSRTQLYRKVKALTNMSANQFVNNIRLEEAKRLISSNDVLIAEVAYRVGYSDPNYFSRKFTQTYGINPKDYKEQFSKM